MSATDWCPLYRDFDFFHLNCISVHIHMMLALPVNPISLTIHMGVLIFIYLHQYFCNVIKILYMRLYDCHIAFISMQFQTNPHSPPPISTPFFFYFFIFFVWCAMLNFHNIIINGMQ